MLERLNKRFNKRNIIRTGIQETRETRDANRYTNLGHEIVDAFFSYLLGNRKHIFTSVDKTRGQGLARDVVVMLVIDFVLLIFLRFTFLERLFILFGFIQELIFIASMAVFGNFSGNTLQIVSGIH